MIKRLNYLPSFFAVRWDLGACSNPCLAVYYSYHSYYSYCSYYSYYSYSLSHAPASLTRACLSHLEAEVEVARSACRACAQRAALIWCARRLLRADGQEFAADAGHAPPECMIKRLNSVAERGHAEHADLEAEVEVAREARAERVRIPARPQRARREMSFFRCQMRVDLQLSNSPTLQLSNSASDAESIRIHAWL